MEAAHRDGHVRVAEGSSNIERPGILIGLDANQSDHSEIVVLPELRQ